MYRGTPRSLFLIPQMRGLPFYEAKSGPRGSPYEQPWVSRMFRRGTFGQGWLSRWRCNITPDCRLRSPSPEPIKLRSVPLWEL